MTRSDPVRADVVVVGSGPNGLAAALLCARAGRRVVVLEAEDTIGGGCRTLPMDGMPGDLGEGLLVDPCSAVHPMAGAAPFFRQFDLAAHGVELRTPPVQLGHALPGRDAIVVPSDPSPASLAEGMGSEAEARAWWQVMEPLAERPLEVVATALSDQRSIPPVTVVAALARAFARAHPLGITGDRFGPDGRTLFSGIASHAISPLSSPAATGVGLILGSLLHSPLGWALPVGGSGAITAALAEALRRAGGEIRTGIRVGSMAQIDARDIVFNTSSRILGEILLSSSPSPAVERRARRLTRAPVGGAAAKVDIVLSGPVPWSDRRLSDAGTLHLGGDSAHIDAAERAVADGRHADRPMVLVSQPWVTDPGRIAPDGRRPLWTYAHVPAYSRQDQTEQVLAALEAVAPGIRDVVVATRCTPASRMDRHNANYAGGDIAAGRVDLRGLVARPVPRVDPYATGVPGIWHASGSTPPGPGVHGLAGQYVAERILRG
ncbi:MULTISPECIES: NAD(P)/FAD-dependent oxidoreductase [unclassified Dietzia]|uniref:phytoene desaturase family protein n=1 Tax=unclassified Dietzia TaxID=2617939 RepID=UPI000D22ABEF|nr:MULTISPECIES: NAD(P)/FAD-dependent oxidoreductase [unclassified Dietzia]AVZ39659.1 NAD(P)/FAD-dependent oxidoreductase [Dietzia sp. JS16-p6b]QGW24971.1 phytoene dehydrogenase-like oxidoreductase [Dietzia sp. DQ12-45-1b]